MPDVYLIGAGKLTAQLGAITGKLMNERSRACLAACHVFERRAKWYASGNAGGPQRQTGDLNNSIQSRVTAADEAQVAPSVYYAAYVEYGTSRSRPHPYMRPAYESGKDEAAKILAAHLAACVSARGITGSMATSVEGYNTPLPED
jgi:HK97 gp10 family phage protein